MCKGFHSVMFCCLLWMYCFFSSLQRGLAQETSSSPDPGGGKGSPIEVSVKVGSDAILLCDAISESEPSNLIEWRINGTKAPIFIKFMTFKPHIDARYSRRLHMLNRSAILISGVKESDAGIYRCKTMQTGSTTTLFKQGTGVVLKVQVPPFFRQQPLDKITAKENGSVTLLCNVGGTPEPEVEWFKHGGNIPFTRASVSTGNRLLNITSLELKDSGNYQCSSSNSVGQLHHVFDLTFERNAGNALPSRRKAVVESFPVVLDCLTDTNLPTENVVYSWTKDGAEITYRLRATIIGSGALFLKSTRRTDSGVFQCTAKTFDSNGLLTYPGSKILLDVQYTPTIVNMPETVEAAEGSDARLPCVSVGNPATDFTNWTSDGEEVGLKPRFAVLEKGSLLIQDVRRTDVGEYACTPFNKVGAGTTKTLKFVLKVVPKFIIAPPSIKTATVSDDVILICEASYDSPLTLSWEREGPPLPEGRTTVDGGKMVIRNIQRDDYGVYVCVASAGDARARHSTTLVVISTPSKPSITSVTFNGSTAVVRWRPGYDGGYPQTFEVWHRPFTANDFDWKRSKYLTASMTSFKVPDLQPGREYFFSVRAVNREGAGPFSSRVRAQGAPSSYDPVPDKKDKPLPPENVIVNITKDGYIIAWNHTAVPGRAPVELFVVEYSKENDSSSWIKVKDQIPAKHREYLLKAEELEADVTYDIRIYAYGANEFSEAAYVSKTYNIGSPVVGARAGDSDVLPIIAGVLGAIAGIFLIGLICFCFVQWKNKKQYNTKAESKRVHFVLHERATESYEPDDSDEEFCDAEIKLRPEAVRFIPDDSDVREDDKLAKLRREEDLLVLTAHEGRYGGEMLRYADLVHASPPSSPGNSSEDSPLPEKVHYFGDVQSAWYDCTLARPAAREVRDSYDQFCKIPSDVGSRDSINKSPPGTGKKALYEQFGNKAYLVQKFGSNNSLPERRECNVLRNPRFQPIREESPRDRDVPRGGAALGRRQPHHWSTPAVFSKQQDSNNNSDGQGSDSDSGDSWRRGRRGRRARPQSLYEGGLLPISEQDSDPKLRCTCDEEEESDECLKYGAAKRRDSALGKRNPEADSSYLHLDRSDSQRLSFVEQLKGWSDPSPNKGGDPYDSHRKHDHQSSMPIDTDSENSVSPALSLVSLSETESDREIAQKLYDSKPSPNASVPPVREQNQATLPRTVSQLRSPRIDSESSSDEQGRRGTRERPKKPSSPVYKEKRPPSVTNLNLNPLERLGSFDQLKACDPFFQSRHRVTRSPSNASSGVYSSETNSMESPRETAKRSSRSSDRSSSDRASSERGSSGYGSSRDSYENQDRLRPGNFSKAVAQRHLNGPKATRLDEPYELDPSSSEMDELETEGSSYNPKVYEDLVALQQRMGVNLDGSDSSRESLKEMEKLSQTDLLEYSPQVSPAKYKVDLLSEAEKDKRCSKLMEEYKTNKRLQDVKASGSQIYRTWDL